MPETLKEWYEWAQKLDWQYRQEKTESKLLGHAHTMHKPHKATGGGGHERAQAQASAVFYSPPPIPVRLPGLQGIQVDSGGFQA